MTLKKKHRIKKVENKDRFDFSAVIIMNSKLRIVKKQIKKYFNDDSVENLHTMRIAIRRMRYSMELFHNCFEKKLYNNVYKHLRKLQDVVGELRDIDVFEEKIHSIDHTAFPPARGHADRRADLPGHPDAAGRDRGANQQHAGAHGRQYP